MSQFALVAVTVILSLTPAQPRPQPASGFKLNFSEAAILAGEKTTKSVSVRAREAQAHAVGDLFISVAGTRVFATRLGQPAWEAKAEVEVAWITAGAQAVYFTSGQSTGSTIETDHDQVRSLDPQTGTWRTPLTVAQDGKPVGARVIALVETGDGLAVSAEVKGGTLVEFFKKQADGLDKQPAWELVFAPGDLKPPEDGAFLRASSYPDRAFAASGSLLAMGPILVVCTGALEPIRGVQKSTGALQWTMERPWEFERGFIGPSVWSHTITRLGQDGFGTEPADGPARAKFDAEHFGTLIAGPAGSSAGGTFFLGTARGPKIGWTNYLLEPTLLEVSTGGSPSSLAPLPRRPLGTAFAATQHSVVWSCQGGTLLCVGPSPQDLGAGMGPGGPDLVSHIQWLRRYVEDENAQAWLSAPGLDGVVGFGADAAYCAAGDMSVKTADQTFVRLPLARVDLNTGEMQRLGLEVPFEGRPLVPTVNVRIMTDKDGNRATRATGPFLMSITGIDVGTKTLLVTVGEEGRATLLEFPLPIP